jgi:diguanylate cyclase (GGDEF)-like protein/PAS domain S-box-containing protein
VETKPEPARRRPDTIPADVATALSRSRWDAILVVEVFHSGSHAPVMRYANDAFYAMTGYAPAEIVDESLARLLHGDASLQRIRAAFARLPDDDFCDLWLVCQDGRRLQVETSILPMPDHGDAAKRFVLLQRDVTQPRIEQAEARRSDEDLRVALDAGTLALWRHDVGTGALRWRGHHEHIFGVAETELATVEGLMGHVHRDDRELLGRILAGMEFAENHEVRLFDKAAGLLRWVAFRGRPVHANRGAQVAGVVMDVTMSHEASTAVADVLETMSDAFIEIDREQRIRYMNRSATTTSAIYGGSELIGVLFMDAFPQARGTDVESAVARALTTGRPQRVEYQWTSANRWLEVRMHPHQRGVGIYYRDITLERSARSQLAFAAAHDTLTGLDNRASLYNRLAAAIGAQMQSPLAVILIDVDHFKRVNDTRGHQCGDELLREIARRLSADTRSADIVARLGGDEFVVCVECGDQDSAVGAGERIRRRLGEPYSIEERVMSVTVSVGVTLVAGPTSLEQVLQRADEAMYGSKRAGRNRVGVV